MRTSFLLSESRRREPAKARILGGLLMDATIAAMLAALLLAGVFELVDVPCPKGSHEPQLSVANDGRVALAWGNDEAIHCCIGAPGKNEEFQRDQLVAKGLKFSVGMRRGPRVALLEDGRVVVTAIGG